MSNATTLRVNGRDYSVTVESKYDTVLKKSLPRYTLTGKRGAKYYTMRNVYNPGRMFLIELGFAKTMENVWLTDEGGTLRVL